MVMMLIIFDIVFACKTKSEIDECAYLTNFLENRDMKTPTNDAEVIEMCK